jgi:hypothetical protein
MLKPNIKYRVTLTAEEREILKNLFKKDIRPVTEYVMPNYYWLWMRYRPMNHGPMESSPQPIGQTYGQ